MNLVSKSENGWELRIIADGSLSCENPKLGEDDISVVEKMLLPEFGERMKSHVFVSCDNWSGVFIMHLPGQQNTDSDNLIREIFDWLSEK